MEPVTIQCGNCSSLMAIQPEHLGQQVQCPTCQAVVQAPASLQPPAPQQPGYNFEQIVEEQESIFATTEQSDDIFNDPVPQPEVPPELMAPPSSPGLGDFAMPSAEETQGAPPVSSVSTPQSEGEFPVPADPGPSAGIPNMELSSSPPALEPTQPYIPAEQPFQPPAPVPEPSPAEIMDAVPEETAPGPVFTNEGETTAPSALHSSASRHRASSGWGLPLLIIPLISWAIFATVALLMLRARESKLPPHPLEMMPDIDGDKTGGRKVSGRGYNMPKVVTELPSNLRVKLGESIRLGDLRVTPERVGWGRIQLRTEGSDQVHEPDEQALKLHLRFENVSENLAFSPLDSYFVRRWPAKKREIENEGAYMHTKYPPFTFMEIGSGKNLKRFYGGPTGWSDEEGRRKLRQVREFIVGQDINREVLPGKDLPTYIASDPEDPKWLAALKKLGKKDPILWRIRVRRGGVMVDGSLKSATAVIGVEFTADQIQ